MNVHDNQDTFNKIATVVADILHIDKNAVSPESSLESLGADSLDMLEIVLKLEIITDIHMIYQHNTERIREDILTTLIIILILIEVMIAILKH